MNFKIIGIILFFIILISIQFTLNQILMEIRKLKRELKNWEERKWIDEKRKDPL